MYFSRKAMQREVDQQVQREHQQLEQPKDTTHLKEMTFEVKSALGLEFLNKVGVHELLLQNRQTFMYRRQRQGQGQPLRRGIMLCTLKSLSELDITNYTSFGQSPLEQVTKKRFTVLQDSPVTDPHRKAKIGYKEPQGQSRTKLSFDFGASSKALDGEDQLYSQNLHRRRNSLKVMLEVSESDYKQRRPVIPQQVYKNFIVPQHAEQRTQSISMSKTSLRRLIQGRTPLRTFPKKSKLNLTSPSSKWGKQNLDTSINSSSHYKESGSSISLEIRGCPGSKTRVMIPAQGQPKDIVGSLREEYQLTEYTSSQLLSLITKQISHLDKMRRAKGEADHTIRGY